MVCHDRCFWNGAQLHTIDSGARRYWRRYHRCLPTNRVHDLGPVPSQETRFCDGHIQYRFGDWVFPGLGRRCDACRAVWLENGHDFFRLARCGPGRIAVFNPQGAPASRFRWRGNYCNRATAAAHGISFHFGPAQPAPRAHGVHSGEYHGCRKWLLDDKFLRQESWHEHWRGGYCTGRGVGRRRPGGRPARWLPAGLSGQA